MRLYLSFFFFDCPRCIVLLQYAVARYSPAVLLRSVLGLTGLTKLWTQPFYAKHQAADGAVILMFKTGADGKVQIAECVIDK